MQLQIIQCNSLNFQNQLNPTLLRNGILILLFSSNKKESPDTPAELAQWQSRMGHALLKQAASHLCAVPAESVVLQNGAHGKPSWNLPVQFNLSHSGKRIVAAFSLCAELGIDIEEPQKKRFSTESQTESFIHRFFHPRELELWKKKAPETRNEFFLQLWTMKEALLKGRGSGLSVSTRTFSLHPGTMQIPLLTEHSLSARARLWKAEDKEKLYRDWNLVPIPSDDCICSLAYRVLKN